MPFTNAYADPQRAAIYATLQFHRTYHLAYRDLPPLLAQHVTGRRAIDFGCGAGRSTRFLRQLGFEVIGVDISGEMLAKAHEIDADGDYRLIPDSGLSALDLPAADVVLSAFTFDNIPAHQKLAILRGLVALLGPRGRLVNLVSTPDIYVHEWASFTTRDYPQNRYAKSGDPVLIINTDAGDTRPVEDLVCSDQDYRRLYADAGLEALETCRPLATGREPYPWVNETRIAPWCLYVLGRAATTISGPG
jgi:SAM-dependent methyltransferase